VLTVLTFFLLSQGVPQQQPLTEGRRTTPPVLSIPDPWLDDSTVYKGYQTRFFRDSKRNTVQIYLDGRSGRAVQLWADAVDERSGESFSADVFATSVALIAVKAQTLRGTPRS